MQNREEEKDLDYVIKYQLRFVFSVNPIAF